MQGLMWWLIGSFVFLLGYLLGALLSRFGSDRVETGAGERSARRRMRATAVTP